MKKVVGLLSAFIIAVSCFSSCGDKEDSVNINNADDLKGKSIGAQIGTTGFILAGDIQDAKVQKYKDGNEAVQALLKKDVDAVIIDKLTAQELINENDNLKILSNPFNEEEYAIAYKKGNTELGEKLNSAIEKLKSDGTLDDISRHWIGKNPDQGGEIVGFDIDMATAICDELGMELKVKNMDFSSIIASVSCGESDIGVAGISVTPERSENVDFTQSYAVSSQVIIVRE